MRLQCSEMKASHWHWPLISAKQNLKFLLSVCGKNVQQKSSERAARQEAWQCNTCGVTFYVFTNTIFHSLVDPKDITVNFSSKLAVPSPPLLIYARLTEFPAADKNEEKKKYRADAQIWRKSPSGKMQPGHIVPFSRTNIFSWFRLANGKEITPVTCRGRDKDAQGFVCGVSALRFLRTIGFGRRCPLRSCSCIRAHAADRARALPLTIYTLPKENVLVVMEGFLSAGWRREESRVKLL